MTTPNEELIDAIVSKAIAQSWQLGQIYWQQADSDYQSQHKKADVTRAKFSDLLTSARKDAADLLQSQAERIAELEKELGDLPEAQAEMLAEIKHLRAQLAEIEKTEPVAWQHVVDKYSVITTQQKESNEFQYSEEFLGDHTIPLFTRPMPADVTELVEALEKLARLGNGEHYGNSDGNMIARDALSKYKGEK